MSSGRAWGLAGLVAAVVVCVDQISKWVISKSLVLDERRDFLPLLDLVRVRNTGVAFGAFSGGRWFVPLLAGFALLGVVGWFALKPNRPGAWLPAGLIVGGAIGNLIDRIRLGAVTDFLKLPHWPAFNVADIAVTAGVVLLVLVVERDGRGRHD